MNKEPKINSVGKSNDFVGIRIEDGEINLYVPQVFRKEKNYKRDLLLFLKSISLIGNPDKEKLNKGSDDTKDFLAYKFVFVDDSGLFRKWILL